MILMAVLAPGFFLAGCSSDDCLNCLDLPPPVVPTGVYSISGDGYVVIQWNDLAYPPYDGSYNEALVAYEVFRRDFVEGDQYNPDRTFDEDPIAHLDWDENFDSGSGLHWYVDENVVNGRQYEYAVWSLNAEGEHSYLSFEFVADAPLPMSPVDGLGWFIPLTIFDGSAPAATGYGFVFGRAAAAPSVPSYGRVTPGVEVTRADIEFFFSAGVPFVAEGGSHVRLQDLGDFSDGAGHVLFEGVTWAPVSGYSLLGEMEIVPGHVYAVEIATGVADHVNFAKFGVASVGAGVVNIIWAYQLIEDLPELSAPVGEREPSGDGPQFISL